VLEILYFDGASYISIKNNETYMGLSEKFSGKKQIWIKEMAN
jgi:hypothetical protein